MSIYEIVKENPTAELPDQKNMNLKAGEAWIPGAYEATLMRSDFRIKQHSWTNYRIANTVKKFILNPTSENMKTVENTFAKYTAISVIDYTLSFMSRMKLSREALHNAAFKLLTESSCRDAVKFAMALIADERTIIEEERIKDAEIIHTISLNEEFTFFGVVALKNILPAGPVTEALLDLGERLSGWGKIAVMYELDYSNPDVRLWTLKNGCKNTIGLSYLSNVCAIKGKLKDYLQELDNSGLPLDPEFLPGICDIFTGLLEIHPENDSIYEYPDAHESAKLFRAAVDRSSEEIKNKASDVIQKLDAKGIGK